MKVDEEQPQDIQFGKEDNYKNFDQSTDPNEGTGDELKQSKENTKDSTNATLPKSRYGVPDKDNLTLDEPIRVTLNRDLMNIFNRTRMIFSKSDEETR